MTVLQNAFREAVRREFMTIPPESELDWEFSEGFKLRMKTLMCGPHYELEDETCDAKRKTPADKSEDA